MTRTLSVILVGCLLVAAAACGDDSSPAQDSKVPDTFVADAAVPDAMPDALAPDTLAPDSMTGDSAPADAVVADAAASDTVAADASTTDAAVADASTADASTSDGATADQAVADSGPPADAAILTDAQLGVCGTLQVKLQEIAVGSTDYVVIKNYGSSAAQLSGVMLEMTGISPSNPDTYTFSSLSLAAGASVYVFEYSSGTQSGDINTGANIPFYNGPPSATSPNAVTLYDAAGKVLDYWAVGASAVNMPTGVSFTPIPWDSTFSSSTHSFQRTKTTGVCPALAAADWVTAALTRP